MSTPGILGRALVFRDSEYPVDDAQNWARVLRMYAEDMGGFTGNVEHAGTLLAAFGQGRRYIQEFFAGKVEVEYPAIWIMHWGTIPTPPIFDYTPTDGSEKGTVIQKSFLENASKHDPADIRLFHNRGKLVLKATYQDLFFLAGIEETHHAVFGQISPDYQEGGDHPEMTSAEYNALEYEWQALHFCIKSAEERGMEELIITQLIKTKEAAALVRQQQGLPINRVPYL